MGSLSEQKIRSTVFKGSQSGQVVQAVVEKDGIGPQDVLLQNLYSGFCGSELHFVGQDMVLGHEGISIVKEVGAGVKHLKKGDRVGTGFNRGGCGSCPSCRTGYHTHCTVDVNSYGMGPTYADSGAFSSYTVAPAMRLTKIPDSIPSECAGPLMCGGQSVFLPLARGDVRPWHTVAIVGIGGLGHLGIQFASKMGCKVIAFSSSADKKDEALKLGAAEFYTTDQLKSDPRPVPDNSINHLMVTTSQLPDWTLYAPLMAYQSNIYPLTVTFDDFKYNAFQLIVKEITVYGLYASTMTQVDQMLDFAARHRIYPICEEFPMTKEGIDEVMEKLKKGDIKYRAVLKVQEYKD